MEDRSQQIVDILQRYEVSSNAPHDTTKEVLDVVRSMVGEGLFAEGDPLWCFSLAIIRSPERREVFVQLDSNVARLKWLRWLYSTNDGQQLTAIPP